MIVLYRTPKQDEIDKCIEIYHKYPSKEITPEMLRECRNETTLGLFECKQIILKYIDETYSSTN